MIDYLERLSWPRAGRLLANPAEQVTFFRWHAIHFSLTGHAWPNEDLPALALFGGDPFGDDLGYGSPCMLAPRTLKQSRRISTSKSPLRMKR